MFAVFFVFGRHPFSNCVCFLADDSIVSEIVATQLRSMLQKPRSVLLFGKYSSDGIGIGYSSSDCAKAGGVPDPISFFDDIRVFHARSSDWYVFPALIIFVVVISDCNRTRKKNGKGNS